MEDRFSDRKIRLYEKLRNRSTREITNFLFFFCLVEFLEFLEELFF